MQALTFIWGFVILGWYFNWIECKHRNMIYPFYVQLVSDEMFQYFSSLTKQCMYQLRRSFKFYLFSLFTLIGKWLLVDFSRIWGFCPGERLLLQSDSIPDNLKPVVKNYFPFLGILYYLSTPGPQISSHILI